MSQSRDVQPIRPERTMQGTGRDGRLASGRQDLAAQLEAVAADIANTVKTHPYATLAVAAGLAFAAGALWKLRPAPRQSQVQKLLEKMPDIVNAKRYQTYWR